VPPSIPFSLAPSPWKHACELTATEGVAELERYCKRNDDVHEHNLLTNDTCNELQQSLMQQIDEQMRQSWKKSILLPTPWKANSGKPKVDVVRFVKDERTGIVSTNLAASVELRVTQASQEPGKGPDDYQFIANAAATLAPDGSIDYSNCYSVIFKKDQNTGFFKPVKDAPIGGPSPSTAPGTTLGSRA